LVAKGWIKAGRKILFTAENAESAEKEMNSQWFFPFPPVSTEKGKRRVIQREVWQLSWP
jgi:hypothetical protein